MDLNEIKDILADTLNQSLQEVVTYSSALWYDALLGITLDGTSTLVFALQGCVGNYDEHKKAWTRIPSEDTCYVKDQLEVILSQTIGAVLPHVSAVIEGTVSVIVNNTHVILFHINQNLSADPTGDTSYSFPLNQETACASDEVISPEIVHLKKDQVIDKLQNLTQTTQVIKPVEDQFIPCVIQDVSEKAKPKVGRPRKKSVQKTKATTKSNAETGEKNVKKSELHTKRTDLDVSTGDQIESLVSDSGTITKTDSGTFENSGENIENIEENINKVELVGVRDSENSGNNDKTLNSVVTDVSNNFDETDPEENNKNKTLLDDNEQLGNINESKNIIVEKPAKRKYTRKKSKSDIFETATNFECEYCGKIFYDISSYTFHTITHKDDNFFKCDFCDKKFNNRGKLNFHRRYHIGDRRYPCSVCDRKFYSSSELNDHKKRHFLDKPYVCDECGNCFATSSSIRMHKLTHTGIKPYECEICHHKFTRKQTLIDHLQIHDGNKKYCCEECGKMFAMPNYLQRHKKTHLETRPHKCEICKKAFVSRAKLANHTRTHTGHKPFICDFCNKGFADWGNMSAHRKIHTGESVTRNRKRKKEAKTNDSVPEVLTKEMFCFPGIGDCDQNQTNFTEIMPPVVQKHNHKTEQEAMGSNSTINVTEVEESRNNETVNVSEIGMNVTHKTVNEYIQKIL